MFQKRLKELREKRKLSQAELAKVLGVAQSTVGMWECGKNKPEYEMLSKIANYFDVSLDSLAGRESTKNAPTEEEIKYALFNGAEGITDDMYEEVLQFAEFVKHKYKK